MLWIRRRPIVWIIETHSDQSNRKSFHFIFSLFVQTLLFDDDDDDGGGGSLNSVLDWFFGEGRGGTLGTFFRFSCKKKLDRLRIKAYSLWLIGRTIVGIGFVFVFSPFYYKRRFFSVCTATQLSILPPHIPWKGQGGGCYCCYATIEDLMFILNQFIYWRYKS